MEQVARVYGQEEASAPAARTTLRTFGRIPCVTGRILCVWNGSRTVASISRDVNEVSGRSGQRGMRGKG